MNTQYKVSVVTPFHNVDMAMFEKCAASMRAQTIGFKNVQWIIVLHNCEESYKQTLPEMFKNDPNVELVVLDNEARTPSSPRNHGTQLVTASYVGYLDGDDSYLPDCLEVAVREAQETKSDLVWFRREAELENSSVATAMVTTLWNNTMKRIIVEHGNWNDDIMFEGLFGYATSFLYNVDFMRSKDVTFSETMLFGEDFLFVVEACMKADRICYLPQHIGYHYFVNANSLVQQGNKPGPLMVEYARGFHRLFDTMRGYGIDVQEIVQNMCFIVARFILSSPGLTVEERQSIKDILGPDIINSRPLPPSKSFNAEQRQIMLFMARDVILNPENPGMEFLKTTTDGVADLAGIIRRNAETDMGRRYHFTRLNSFMAFQSRVPLTDKDYYRPLIDLQTRVGEHNILTADPVVRYLASSDGELTPFTERQSRPYAECLGETLKGKHNLLFVRSHPVTAHTNDGAVVDTLNSAIVKDYFAHCHFRDGQSQAQLASPVERYFASSQSEDDFYDLMVDALSVSDAQQLVAFTAKDMLAAFQTLEARWQQMVDSMPIGERRDEVQRILSEGFDKPVVPRLWPNLERVVCFGAGKMSESMQQLRRYIGDLPHNQGYDYLKSAVMGKAVEDDSDLFECIKEHCFYEFLPADTTEGKTLLWSELEIGKAYRVVVTNHAGLYRYRTGHVIVPQEVTPQNIKFTIN